MSDKSKNEMEHYNAVLIESLRADFKFVIEKVEGSETRIMQVMNTRFAEHEEYFRQIMKVLAHHSEMFQKNDQRWEQNDKRWDQNDKRWEQNDQRWEQNEKRWQQAERSFDLINAKLDSVTMKVEDHDLKLQHIS